jgi:hypothetical protein
MMSTEQFKEFSKTLKDIDDKLSILIILQKRVAPKPPIGVEETKVLKLCDKKHTIDNIVKETGKTENNVKVTLSNLRGKGLIRSLEINGIVVYEEI